MTLTKYLTLLPSTLSTADKVEYLQEAYYTAVKKLRLDPSLHPLRFTDHIKLEGFNSMAVIIGSLSQLALKEFNGIIKADDLETLQDFGTIGTASVGNLDEVDYSYTNFYETNEFHNTVPLLYQIGSSIVCDNVADCFFILNAYAYPYFCYTANDPYTDRYYYDIQTMITNFGSDNLTVDPVLGVLSLMLVHSKYRKNIGDYISESGYHKFSMDLINIHNQWKETLRNDNLDFIGQLDGSIGLS